ncbi:MAG: hypothetical protein KDA53_12635 [Hyphomonas sp.]|nr:hypothetical protein [Hyphomonas sp.]
MAPEDLAWFIFEVPVSRQSAAVAAIRAAGFGVVRLMCFADPRPDPDATVRAHRSVRKRRKPARRVVPALDTYVFVGLEDAGQVHLVEACHKAVERFEWMGAPAARLSRIGVGWLMDPPRGLFPDTAVPRLGQVAGPGEPAFRAGDAVTLYTHAFDGCQGEVIRITRGGRVRVQLHGAMFEVEADPASVALSGSGLPKGTRAA